MTGAVIACGPSLQTTPKPTGVVTVGVNDSFKWLEPDWLCVLNADWWEREPEALMRFHRRGRLVALRRTDRPIPVGIQVPSNKGRRHFSTSLAEGFYTGNATLFALQWAALIGLNLIYVYGLDLSGDGHGSASRPTLRRNLERQRAQFREAAPLIEAAGITVYNCNPESACDVFPFGCPP